MTDANDPNIVEIRRIDPEDWKPIIGDDMPEYIARIAKSTGKTKPQVIEAFHKPDHEFTFKFPNTERLQPIEEGIRVMGHELGPWSLFTIWDTNQYVYHATTKLGDGMMWEDAAGQIFQRWIQTMPLKGGAFGSGKTVVH
jgi:hypothetical protein